MVKRTDVLVGIFVIVALALAFAVVRGIKTYGWIGGDRYPLRIVFGELTEALPSGSPVRLAGVTVGRVDGVRLASPADIGGVPDSYGAADQVVVVDCRIAEGTIIRENYRVTVASGFPLGETYIDVMPTRATARALEAGEVLIGEVVPAITDIAPLVAQSLDEVNRAAQSIADVATVIATAGVDVAQAAQHVSTAAGDVTIGVGALTGLIQSTQGDIKATFANLNAAAVAVADIGQALAPVVTDQGFTDDMRRGVRSLADTGEHLARVAESLDQLIADEDNKARMQSTIESIARTTANLEQITANVYRVTNNPENAANLEAMLEDSASAAENLAALTLDLRDIVGREGLKEDITQITTSLASASASLDKLLSDEKLNQDVRDTAANLASATGTLDEMVDDALKENVQGTAADLSAVAAELRRLMTETNATRDFEAAMSGLREATETLSDFARELRGLTTDEDAPEGEEREARAGGVGATLSAAKSQVHFADRNFRDTHLRVTEDVLYSPSRRQFSTNFDVEYRRPGRYGASGGMYDIGRGNRVKFQINKPYGDFLARAGIYHTEPGVGLDWDAGRKARLSLDAYSANRPDVDVHGSYQFGEHIRVNARVEAVFSNPNTMLGLGWRF